VNTDRREIREPTETMEWERGTFQLSGVVVLRPSESAAGKTDRRRFEIVIVSHSQTGNGIGFYAVLDKPPGEDDGPTTKGSRKTAGRAMAGFNQPRQQFSRKHSLPWESWSAPPERFEVRTGRINDYTTALPEELISAVREKLAAPAASDLGGSQ
jgi:hypothetical protein